MTTVAKLLTPLSRLGMRRALVDGHVAAFGVTPSLERLACALAQLCEEHANGADIFCDNFGNIDSTAEWEGDVFQLTAREVVGGVAKLITKTLRAYPDATCGARGYWLFLSLPRFAHALAAFGAGNATGAAYALKAGGWYTDDVVAYARAMRLLYAECWALGEEVAETLPPLEQT